MHSIQYVNISDIKENPTKYNSNNHWSDGIIPADYTDVNIKTDSKFWLPKFRDEFITLDFSAGDVSVLKSMLYLSRLHNKISTIHKEDICDIIAKFPHVDELLKSGKFIRTENVSLKYGKHGIGPYTNLFNIIESILTSPHGHCPFYETTTALRLYIIPWVNINKFKEFRVFVCDGKLTAISQQHLYDSNELLASLEDYERTVVIRKWMDIITSYFDGVVKINIDHMSNYVYDFAILDDDSPYFIEINPFGKEYSSGSSLYHWLTDEDKLYGKTEFIYFRYAV